MRSISADQKSATATRSDNPVADIAESRADKKSYHLPRKFNHRLRRVNNDVRCMQTFPITKDLLVGLQRLI